MFMTNEFIREKTNVSTFRGRYCLSAKGNAFVLKDMKTKEIQKGVSFGSFYLCRNFLPKDLIFEELEN